MNEATIKQLCERLPSVRLKDKAGEPINKVTTAPCRLAFVDIVRPNDKGKYEACLVFPKDAKLTALSELKDEVMRAKFGDKRVKSPFKKQDQLAEKYDGFEDGGWYCDVKSGFQPKLLSRDGQSYIEINDATIYAGMWVRAMCHAYAYDNDGNRGVALGLDGFQYLAHDEKLQSFTLQDGFASEPDDLAALEDLLGADSASASDFL